MEGRMIGVRSVLLSGSDVDVLRPVAGILPARWASPWDGFAFRPTRIPFQFGCGEPYPPRTSGPASCAAHNRLSRVVLRRLPASPYSQTAAAAQTPRCRPG